MSEPENVGEENVRVVIRVRPAALGSQCVLRVDERSSGEVLVDGPCPRTFCFDLALGPDCRQRELFHLVALPAVDQALRGANATVLAYGQTGSGKTYTMDGESRDRELWGIVPNAFQHIFDTVDRVQAAEGSTTTFEVYASYLEIHNEKVHDLLGSDPRSPLRLLEDPAHGVFVKDLTAYVVRSAGDLRLVAAAGARRRAVASTLMNQRSSRSHAIVQVTVQRREGNRTRVGMLNLVDLAGSERQSRTGAVGKRLLESCKINQSLATLGKVIGALLEGDPHVPYRESKLTRVLKDSLGGSAATVVVAHVSPLAVDREETLCTLWWADRARRVRNCVRVNESPRDAAIERYLREITTLRSELQVVGASADDVQPSEQDSLDDGSMEVVSREGSAESDWSDRDEEQELRMWEHEKEQQQLQLMEAAQEKEGLRDRQQRLQLNFMVNGESLLEKYARQDRLLQEYAREMEAMEHSQHHLESQLRLLEVEVAGIEDRCCWLQEDAEAKNRKINKVMAMMGCLRDQLEDVARRKRGEVRRKRYQLQQMDKQVKWCDLLIASCVPSGYLRLVNDCMQWSEETEEWTILHGDLCGKARDHSSTVARLGQWRAGPRPPTEGRFRSYERAADQDAAPQLCLPRLLRQ